MRSSASPSSQDVNGVAVPISIVGGTLVADPVRLNILGPNRVHLPLARDSSKLAFTLEQVLTPSECERLIRAAESLGFAPAGLGRTGEQAVVTEFRDSARLISEDPLLAEQIFQRIQPFLPTVWQGRRLLGLNEQLKFLRYGPGQKLVAHFDGAFC